MTPLLTLYKVNYERKNETTIKDSCASSQVAKGEGKENKPFNEWRAC